MNIFVLGGGEIELELHVVGEYKLSFGRLGLVEVKNWDGRLQIILRKSEREEIDKIKYLTKYFFNIVILIDVFFALNLMVWYD